MKSRFSDLSKAMLFSYLSYILFLAVVIGVDTFMGSDFSFGRAIMISVVFLSVLSILFLIMFMVFRIRLSSS